MLGLLVLVLPFGVKRLGGAVRRPRGFYSFLPGCFRVYEQLLGVHAQGIR